MSKWLKIIWKIKVIWRIIRDRQVVIITESYGKLYYNWDTRSLNDVCRMCQRLIRIILQMRTNLKDY